MAQEFETGLSTAAANDTALTVSNDGEVYRKFRAYIGREHRAIARAVVVMACRHYGKEWYGRSFVDSDDFDSCVEYVTCRWTEN
jgi:hypothetical protein